MAGWRAGRAMGLRWNRTFELLGAHRPARQNERVGRKGCHPAAARATIRKPSVQRAVNRTGGTLMVGAGLLAFGWRKAAV